MEVRMDGGRGAVGDAVSDALMRRVPARVRQRLAALPQDVARIACRAACARQTAISARTPSVSMLAPSPPATISPRLMTQ
jgi:hypothetical protein